MCLNLGRFRFRNGYRFYHAAVLLCRFPEFFDITLQTSMADAHLHKKIYVYAHMSKIVQMQTRHDSQTIDKRNFPYTSTKCRRAQMFLVNTEFVNVNII